MTLRYQQVLKYAIEVARSGSIRRAADRLNITSSALNRRIQDLEAELQTELFQRWARGVRLTSAGETFVHFARAQLAEGDRLQSTLEDLRGLRRGHVAIACSQALIYDYLPRQLAAFQKAHPLITFGTRVGDHDLAISSIINYDSEIAIAYRPSSSPLVQRIAVWPQRTMALMRADHPLAARSELRLSELVDYPLAVPDRRYGSRQLVEQTAARRGLKFSIKVESDSFEMLRGVVLESNLISLQIEIGTPTDIKDLVARPIDLRDAPAEELVLCQLRGRSLSVAAASFAEWIAHDFEQK